MPSGKSAAAEFRPVLALWLGGCISKIVVQLSPRGPTRKAAHMDQRHNHTSLHAAENYDSGVAAP